MRKRQRCLPARALVAATAVLGLTVTGVSAASAATTDPNPSPRELANAALSRQAATEGMVLLENHDQALPLARPGNVALYGVGAIRTVKGGTGSGAVNNRYTISVRQGFENAGYAVTTNTDYWTALTGSGNNDPALTAATAQPTAPTDTAANVAARNSGEGRDRSPGPADTMPP
ncbi:MAG: glycoside hydrolase family 3 C-terminal domain-containing protein, partial [Promicromonosporaceae bacterium]|nr:glycoside hydrolase family 3 C-terminal domain-containing protein [Promicromonosporaceae bacterium]